MTTTDHERILREAAARRFSALMAERRAVVDMNAAVRAARGAGVPAQVIAGWIGTSRQRVYEILRG